MAGKGDRRTPSQRKRAFLDAFSRHGLVIHAAEEAQIDRRSHQRWMHEDPVYAEAFEQARGEVLEVVEREIHRRSVEGWNEPVWYQGEMVGEVRKFSDVLLIFRAKALAPERYRDRFQVTAEVTHHDGDSKLDTEIAGLLADMGRLEETPSPVAPPSTNGSAPPA